VNARGMDETDARNRIANQASREKRLAIASHVVDNSGDVETLREQVADVWGQITG
jgi:dephospho-CoA kinase